MSSEQTPLVHEDDEDDELDLEFGLASLSAVLRPVALTMGIASVLVVKVRLDVPAAVLFNDDDDAEGNAARLGKGVANALVIVLLILVTTCAVVALYGVGCAKCLRGYLVVSSALLLGLMGGLLAQATLDVIGIQLDALTFYFLLYNWAACGILAVYFPRYFKLEQATPGYLIAASVVMAWQLSNYPAVTTWCTLVLLAVYDAFAVLAPCGPLRVLVDLLNRRQDPLPGLLYEAEIPDSSSSKLEERDSVKLGLGDFVFYSVLVSSAAKHHWVTAVACALSTLVGLAATLGLLAVYKTPLPALPISIALGVSCYFAVDFLLLPTLAALRSDCRIYV